MENLLRPHYNPQDEIVAYEFYCPGCKHSHVYYTKAFEDQPVWNFNGDMQNPSFTPSLLNWWDKPGTNETIKRCHLYVTNSKIQFMTDCTHSLNGQTVDMVPFK